MKLEDPNERRQPCDRRLVYCVCVQSFPTQTRSFPDKIIPKEPHPPYQHHNQIPLDQILGLVVVHLTAREDHTPPPIVSNVSILFFIFRYINQPVFAACPRHSNSSLFSLICVCRLRRETRRFLCQKSSGPKSFQV